MTETQKIKSAFSEPQRQLLADALSAELTAANAKVFETPNTMERAQFYVARCSEIRSLHAQITSTLPGGRFHG